MRRAGVVLVVLVLSACLVPAAGAAPVYQLTVSVAGLGSGAVTSPAGIACPPTCSVLLTSGTDVMLTATESGGSTFTGWVGSCGGTAQTCAITLNGNRAAQAMFGVQVGLT